MRVWPSYFQRDFLANQKSRAPGNSNVEGVRAIGHNLREAFFLHVQAFIAAVQRDAQGMGARGERAVEIERFPQMGGLELGRNEDILAGVDGEGFLSDPRDDLDAKRRELLGSRELSVGGWGSRGGPSNNRSVRCRPCG
jgi:hypothetical protein